MELNTKTVMTALAFIPLAAGVTAWGAQKLQKMLIYPSNMPDGARTQCDTPDKFKLPYEDVTIATTDGEKLQAFVMLVSVQKGEDRR